MLPTGHYRPRRPPALPDDLIEAVAAAREVCRAHADRHDRDGTFPAEGIRAAQEAGLLEATVGREWGGRAVGLEGAITLLAELARGDASVALIGAMQVLVHAREARELSWPADVYRGLVEAGMRGELLVNALAAEPAAGSLTRGALPATVATAEGDGWVLSGRKTYATGSHGLTHMIVVARTGEERPRMGQFLVEAAVARPRIIETWDHLGLRASCSHDVVFEGAPAVAVGPLAEPGEAADPPPGAVLGSAAYMLGLPGLYLGVARRAQEVFERYARARTPSGQAGSLATTQRFVAAAGEVDMELGTAESVLLDCAAGVDRGDLDAASRSAIAKVAACRAVDRAMARMRGLLGNPGLSRPTGFERLYRDSLCMPIHAPAEDVVLSAVGANRLEHAA